MLYYASAALLVLTASVHAVEDFTFTAVKRGTGKPHSWKRREFRYERKLGNDLITYYDDVSREKKGVIALRSLWDRESKSRKGRTKTTHKYSIVKRYAEGTLKAEKKHRISSETGIVIQQPYNKKNEYKIFYITFSNTEEREDYFRKIGQIMLSLTPPSEHGPSKRASDKGLRKTVHMPTDVAKLVQGVNASRPGALHSMPYSTQVEGPCCEKCKRPFGFIAKALQSKTCNNCGHTTMLDKPDASYLATESRANGNVIQHLMASMK